MNRIAVLLLGVALSTGACNSFNQYIPGPGKCRPGYHHRLANQHVLSSWCIKDEALGRMEARR